MGSSKRWAAGPEKGLRALGLGEGKRAKLSAGASTWAGTGASPGAGCCTCSNYPVITG